MKKTKLMMGDNILSLKKLPDNSIDSIVTDPPYALTPSKNAKVGFMGKLWDSHVPSVEFWEEVYRVLKPGGHVLSFGGTRTYHRMVVNLEDAGFEIRDCISWLYGSGFPKSMNIGKNVDKIQGNEREVVAENGTKPIQTSGRINSESSQSGKFDREINTITKGSSPQEGQGTGLKPAQELICMARKPISEKTITDNVLKWGTGGINVDGCRIGSDIRNNGSSLRDINGNGLDAQISSQTERIIREDSIVTGRFPANIILDEEAAKALDNQSGIVSQGHWPKGATKGFGEFGGGSSLYEGVGPKDKSKSGASRFFYVAKVSSKERNMGLGDGFEDKQTDGSIGLHSVGGSPTKDNKRVMKNFHPTVKPINLLTYLVRLVTPTNGIVLDPYMGSGSTGIASQLEGFDFIGMEMDEDYFKIASERISKWEEYKKLIKK